MYLRLCGPSGVHTASILRKRKNEYDYASLDKGIIIFFEIYLSLTPPDFICNRCSGRRAKRFRARSATH